MWVYVGLLYAYLKRQLLVNQRFQIVASLFPLVHVYQGGEEWGRSVWHCYVPRRGNAGKYPVDE